MHTTSHQWRRRRRPRDPGSTLVEIVIAIALIGIIVVPTLAAMGALIRVSTTSREAANIETVLLNVADRINRAPTSECDYTAYAQAAVVTHGWSASDIVVGHQYYDVVNDTWITGPAGAAACPASGNRPLLVKLVTLTVTSPQADISRTIQVVKSDI